MNPLNRTSALKLKSNHTSANFDFHSKCRSHSSTDVNASGRASTLESTHNVQLSVFLRSHHARRRASRLSMLGKSKLNRFPSAHRGASFSPWPVYFDARRRPSKRVDVTRAVRTELCCTAASLVSSQMLTDMTF